MNILVVDDEKLIVKGICFSLEQEGMEVDCAYDGEEALEYAKKCEYDLVLLDPGRAGAEEVMPWLAKSNARRIVYVSCNPVTAARDCALLQLGYRLKQWGLLDMFPHTGHVESLFLFERQ